MLQIKLIGQKRNDVRRNDAEVDHSLVDEAGVEDLQERLEGMEVEREVLSQEIARQLKIKMTRQMRRSHLQDSPKIQVEMNLLPKIQSRLSYRL